MRESKMLPDVGLTAMNDKRHDDSPDPLGLGMTLPPGRLTVADELALAKYAVGRRLAVEVGTFLGRSAALLARFAERVISIDSYPYKEPVFEDVRASLAYIPNLALRKNLSNLAAGEFTDGSVDLFFVDAGHRYQDVMRDFWCFFDKLCPEAIIIFHDYKLMAGGNPMMNVRGPVDHLVSTGVLELIEAPGWCAVCRIKK